MTQAAPLRPEIGSDALAALPDPAEFGALLASRICHDLISPVGAIGNGVELMQEISPGADGAELQLIGRSAQMASASLQFLRLAFGAAPPDDAMGLPALQRTARLWFGFQRPELVWADAQGETTRASARLLCNFLQIAVSCLPRGGEIAVSVTRDEEGETMLEVTADGPVVAPSPEAERWLAGRSAETPASPRDAHYLAAAAHARAAGVIIDFRKEETGVVLRAAMPAGI